ncbi:MAG: Ig-like domain-containing protein [Parvibaculum sp.]|uniref:phage head completion protein n=1 Tax=Parvibaculum sp. TaxID=2024848 RepID=UPI002AB8B547|nr:Ig-like domain-containing protein [Parvibaculum sp.]MDZ4382806.1 Ig-like domain-containing protein [Parvibaculum sp.]
MKSTTAGQFRSRFAFEKRLDSADGFGNVHARWVRQFTRRARYAPLKGGESVMAARLASKVPALLTIRRDSATALIDAAWRCVDLDLGTIHEVRTVTVFPDRPGEMDLLVESGVSAAAAPEAPAAPAITTASPFITNDATPEIAGTAAPSAIVTVLLDGVALSPVFAASDGTWSYVFETLADAAYSITARQETAGGISAASSALAMTVDTAAPAAPVITTASPLVTNDNTPDVAGTAEANASVQLYIDGLASGAPVTADGGGNWAHTFDAITGGSYAVTAKATDAAGNTSPASAALALTIDLTPPVAPAFATASPFVTTDTTPTITGTAEALSAVTVYLDGLASGVPVTADGSGNWSFTFGTLAIGSYAVTATATDQAGNESPESPALTLQINAALAISGTPSALAIVGDAYSFVPSITGGVPPYAAALTGTLPAGLDFDTETGAISGVAADEETASGLVITVTDAEESEVSLPAFSISARYAWKGDFIGAAYWVEGEAVPLTTALATARASAALGVDGSGTLKSFGTNAPALLSGIGLDIWASRQNKGRNHNANPPALVTPTSAASFNAAVAKMVATAASNGLTLFGVVDDAAEIAAAGLSEVCNGRVYKMDNSAGGNGATLLIQGVTGNTNAHMLSAMWRGAGTGQIRFGNAGSPQQALPAAYQRVSAGATPNTTTREMYLLALPGAVLYFILNQLEEGTTLFPPIETAGSVATREASAETIPDFGALAAAHGWASGFEAQIEANVSRLSSSAARVLASFGADAANSCRVEIGTDNKVYAIVRKSGIDEVTLVTADAWGAAPGEVLITARFKPGDYALTVTGLTGDADADAETLPALTAARLGARLAGTDYLNGPLALMALKAAA